MNWFYRLSISEVEPFKSKNRLIVFINGKVYLIKCDAFAQYKHEKLIGEEYVENDNC